MKGLPLVLLALLVGGCTAPDDKPNIIFIMADDLGYGDVGAYGQKVIKTPNIDRLAAEGIRFTDHYAGHASCRPSRLALWTGRHTGHTAISSNAGYVLQPDDVTVADLLRDAGYATGGVGKWTLGGRRSSGHPKLQGFDFWMGYLDQWEAHNYYPSHLWRNRDKVLLEGNVLMEDARAHQRVSSVRLTYSHDVMTEEALGFVRRHKDRPFLLHLHWTLPHANNERGELLGDGLEVPDYGSYEDRGWPLPEKGYAAMIERLDRDVGRIVNLLQELEIDQRTLVIFTSDNGPHDDGGHDHEFFDSNGPLRGYKSSLHEGGIRVPMIARWPGRIAPGTTSDHVSAFWDFLPTACEIVGISAPEEIDGVSYAPTLLGEEQEQHEYLFWRIRRKIDETRVRKEDAVRAGRWKYRRARGVRRLYDLSVDVGEQDDVAADYPEVVERLEAYAAEAYAE